MQVVRQKWNPLTMTAMLLLQRVMVMYTENEMITHEPPPNEIESQRKSKTNNHIFIDYYSKSALSLVRYEQVR